MSKALTIVDRVDANSLQVERVKSERLKLVEPTLNKAGCIQTDCHQDIENPAVFLFYENWESRDAWQVHMNNPVLAEYMRATEGAIASFNLNKMSQI